MKDWEFQSEAEVLGEAIAMAQVQVVKLSETDAVSFGNCGPTAQLRDALMSNADLPRLAPVLLPQLLRDACAVRAVVTEPSRSSSGPLSVTLLRRGDCLERRGPTLHQQLSGRVPRDAADTVADASPAAEWWNSL